MIYNIYILLLLLLFLGIKAICDGYFVGEQMYRPGNNEVKLNCRLFLATNHAIKFDQDDDGGIDRRVIYYRYKYKFVQSPNQNRNPFEREMRPLPEFDDNYKNAI